MSSEIFYQMFEMYYQKAVQAEEKGRAEEAKKMYLLAGESLLKSAKESSGETKAALVRRADKILRLADQIEIPEAKPDDPDQRGNGSAKQAGAEGRSASDEEGTVWKRAGKPDIRFEDIAGLDEVKESIRRRVLLPRQYPELYETFHRKINGGILLYGPPGTGKTMMAKAIAAEIDAEFYPVSCSDIVGKYFGEAEKNVKSLFEAARRAEHAVLFFDEFEALAAKRGGDSTVMNRLVPELLSQMDGFSDKKQSNILILAATNRPWDLDSAFMRPPRLTEKIYVGLPDYEARFYLIKKAFAGVPCADDVELNQLAERTEGYNAADMAALCDYIKDLAIDRSRKNEEVSAVRQEDLTTALDRVHSSVQHEDIRKIQEWEKSMMQ